MAAAHLPRQFEHAREHCRDELAVRHPTTLDGRQELFGIEVLHDDCGTAHTDRPGNPAQWCRVVKRGRREIDHVFAKTTHLHQGIEDWQRLPRQVFRQRPRNALGASRRAG